MPPWIKWLLQLLVSLGLIGFVLAKIDLEQARAVVVSPRATPGAIAGVLLGFLLFNASKIAGALRLNVYQRHIGIGLSEMDNLRLCYAGMFLNLFLPGGIGGDGYRVAVLTRRQHAPVRTLVLITLGDRVSGLLMLLLLLLPMYVFLLHASPLLAATAAFLPAFAGFRELAIGGTIVIAAGFVLLHVRLLRINVATMLALGCYSLVLQVLQLACILLLLLYLQVPPGDFHAYLVVFLVSSVTAVLPLSIGGLGAREITFYYGLQLLSLEPTLGIVASTGFFLITMLSSSIGALFVGRTFVSPTAGALRR